MSFLKEINSDDLYYSCLYAGGIYRHTKQVVADPLDINNAEIYSPLLENILTREIFYMKQAGLSDEQYERQKRNISGPPSMGNILWPIDMIDLDNKAIDCSLKLANRYTDSDKEEKTYSHSVGILFKYEDRSELINAKARLKQIRELSWKNPVVLKIVKNIVQNIESLNRCGYVYEDIHFSRMYFNKEDELFLDYSGIVLYMADIFSKNAKKMCEYQENEYPIEFADPSIYRGLKGNLDFQAQNFSLAALLFYLMLGRYPYDGALLDGHNDNSIMNHYVKFRDYIKAPVFIFDPNDKQNALGSFAEEIDIIKLWEDLPSDLQNMFSIIFVQSNAERKNIIDNPTPSMWLNAFLKLGWGE